MKNPFPGPQPYRAEDRARFFGRVDLSDKLQGAILASRCVTVHGPSGAGKSSLLQASVFPTLIERHDVQLVRVDAWPEGEEPIRWLAAAMHAELGFGDLAPEENPQQTVFQTARGAARASSRMLVIYLDQLEQLLFPGRTIEETQPFFDCAEELLDLPLRNVRVVLSLREDYLGRFRDRLRDLRRMTESGFRVGPMSVDELTEAVVSAAASGEPTQSWSAEEMRGLMMQVRVPGQAATDDAEAQSAYAQIICRALFQERAQGKTVDVREAEPILQRYLESTITGLGSLRNQGQQLLEDHLVSADGSRTLRTEKELAKVITSPDLAIILKQLEGAAILRAEEHHGSRYFEIGHDWLARRVFEQRVERERLAEQKRIEQKQAQQLAEARVQQRRLRGIVAVSIVITALVSAAGIVALLARSKAETARQEADTARQAAEAAEKKAQWERDEANDSRLMAGYLALQNQGDVAGAMKLLTNVKKPAERSDWVADANTALEQNALFVTLRGHRGALRQAAYSSDGELVLTASDDRTARVWKADGTGAPIVLEGHKDALTFAEFSPESKADAARVLTTSTDGTARVWSIQNGQAKSIVLQGESASDGKTMQATSGAWSPDGQRLAIATMVVELVKSNNSAAKRKETFFVRMYSASDGTVLGEYVEHRGRVHATVFLDDTRVMTVSEDKSARVWDSTKKGPSIAVPGHAAPVLFVTVNRDRGLVVTTSADNKARVFKIGPTGALTPHATLDGHTDRVVHAAISSDGKFVATAADDRTARVWNIEKQPLKGSEVVLGKHDGAVTFVAFRKDDSRVVATASSDQQGRVFDLDEPSKPFVLSGHVAPLASIVWSPSGRNLITAAVDMRSSASGDHTARIWRADAVDQISRRIRRKGADGTSVVPFHAAAFSSNRDVVAIAFDDSTVELRDGTGDGKPFEVKALSDERWGFISAAIPSPDGERVAIASFGDVGSDGTQSTAQPSSDRWMRALHIVQKSSFDKPMQQREVDAAIRHLAWSKTGDRIVAALEDKTAMVFAVGGTDPPVILRGHTNWLTSASFSADGQKIVTTSLDTTAMVFPANGKGEPLARFPHPEAVYSATFDPTGKLVATACADGKVRIFELGSSAAPKELEVQGFGPRRVVWSADGKRIAAASSRGPIAVWSGFEWPLVRDLQPIVLPMSEPAVALAFVDGGHRLHAVADDRIRAWELDIDKLRAEIKAANRDCLLPPDRLVFLHETPKEAIKGFEDCEASWQRVRPAKQQEKVQQRDLVVARVITSPSDADIEVDGAPATSQDGLLELWGKAGDKKKVRLVKGARSIAEEITIESSGAKPTAIELPPPKSTEADSGFEEFKF